MKGNTVSWDTYGLFRSLLRHDLETADLLAKRMQTDAVSGEPPVLTGLYDDFSRGGLFHFWQGQP